jgi:hypothetical protein
VTNSAHKKNPEQFPSLHRIDLSSLMTGGLATAPESQGEATTAAASHGEPPPRVFFSSRRTSPHFSRRPRPVGITAIHRRPPHHPRHSVFMSKLDKFIVVFINDILIYSKNEEEHEQHLQIVLQRLLVHQLYAKFSKCTLWLKDVPFLWHAISAEDIIVDLSKVQEVLEWKSLRSVMQIRSFLELVGYYRRFILNFSKFAKPMTKLLENDAKFK